MAPDNTLPASERNPYPRRLYHAVPWAKDGSWYHIRLRALVETPRPLTDPALAPRLLETVQFYHQHGRWNCLLVLLMPDHAHALLAFSSLESMSATVGAWKAYTARQLGVRWQSNYFDHRIRDPHNLQVKGAYIRRNPVVKGLCQRETDWPWIWPHAVAEQPARRSGST